MQWLCCSIWDQLSHCVAFPGSKKASLVFSTCIPCNNIRLVNRPTTSLCYIRLKLLFVVKIQNSNIQSQQHADCRSCRESRYLYEVEKSAKYMLWMCCTVFTVLVFAPIGIEGSVPKPSGFSGDLQRVRAISYEFLHLCISSGSSVCHPILEWAFSSLRGQIK